MKEKTAEIAEKVLVVFDETAKCIKEAKTEKERKYVRALLNTIAALQSQLEDFYKNPEEYDDIPRL